MPRSVLQLGTLATGAIAAALWCFPCDAAAAPSDGGKGKRFRLHIDTDFFGFTHYNPDPDGVDSTNAVGFGIGRPTVIDTGAFGLLLPRPVLGIGFAYAFLETRALVGARVSFAVDGLDVGDAGEATLVTGQLVPYFRWIFLPGRWARPYVEARFGFGGGSRRFEDDVPPFGTIDQTDHVIWPTVGVGGGVHLFVVDYFSIDLGLNFDYMAPHGRTTFDDDAIDDTDWEKAGDLINLAILAGFSAWF